MPARKRRRTASAGEAPGDFAKMTVVKLRGLLKSRGLDHKGKKAELVARLKATQIEKDLDSKDETSSSSATQREAVSHDNNYVDGVDAGTSVPSEREDLSKLTVAKLRARLKSHGLDHKGKKAMLLERLSAALDKAQNVEDAEKVEKNEKVEVKVNAESSAQAIEKPELAGGAEVVESEDADNLVKSENAVSHGGANRSGDDAEFTSSSARGTVNDNNEAGARDSTNKLPVTKEPEVDRLLQNTLAEVKPQKANLPEIFIAPSSLVLKPGPLKSGKRESKAARRRRLKKNAKKRKYMQQQQAKKAEPKPPAKSPPVSSATASEGLIVKAPETILEGVNLKDDATRNHFLSILQKFSGNLDEEDDLSKEGGLHHSESDDSEDAMDMDEDEVQPERHLSNKSRKRQARLTVAQLKQLVDHPEVVEDHDVTSLDARLLVHLKSLRGTVPVPRHWSQKRKYLQGKQGFDSSPYELPAAIAATGITKVREAIQEQEDEKKLKQKQRERVRPKMGKININYQALYDAFFSGEMEKPHLTEHGDVYFEGKEDASSLGAALEFGRRFRPGHLSDELRAALGMPLSSDENSSRMPSPWLFNMQRYGPPPTYPRLKVPGLNAPIPSGAQFGYQAGGWGKPPVDASGRPLYGDSVFDNISEQTKVDHGFGKFDRSHWGVLEDHDDDEEEEEEEEDENVEEGSSPDDASRVKANASDENDSDVDMDESDDEDYDEEDEAFSIQKADVDEQPKQLYKVLDTTKSNSSQNEFVGSTHIYEGIGNASNDHSAHSLQPPDSAVPKLVGQNNDDNEEDDEDANDDNFKF